MRPTITVITSTILLPTDWFSSQRELSHEYAVPVLRHS
ncbi:hypothetical protein AA0113_g11115 [Alternaria arborescens]|uniref:Uncharacterized protein n=2 Tax=Alternaria sect. Alternaria TaxID=2499237 RepID=A0A4Q4N080_ALTAL|nr:hypothetical protein AA0112_g11948 [Alternaria arborescens]RYN65523.1 hypothetical protein AA0117_g12094 [Alternaria alternata]RYO13003.1 hypothetical protein AA0121_g8717 [Alternaria tenuissima]RYO39802.1 hypothetical protein AA0113_g11115 [Alternaria arborescens]